MHLISKKSLGTLVLTLAIAALPHAATSAVRSVVGEPAASGDPAPLTDDQKMLWKYVARCAMPEGQPLAAPAAPGTQPLSFDGGLGLAPEWRDGKCDAACQERVSSCLLALTNPTGFHVQVSLLSMDPTQPKGMLPSEGDRDYPFQEGVFFGNFFEGEGYSCHGRDADKGVQIKRLCAVVPELCSGFVRFADAGRCEDSCQMSCTTIPDGSTRCVAVACHDPSGRVWTHPITTYLRNRLEAGNTHELAGASRTESGLAGFGAHARATYRQVDFGHEPGGLRAVVANIAASQGGGRIDVVLARSGRRIGTIDVPDTSGVATDVTAPLRTHGLSGPQDVVLRFRDVHRSVRMENFGLR